MTTNICSSACQDPVIKVIKSHAPAHKWISSSSRGRAFPPAHPERCTHFGVRWRQPPVLAIARGRKEGLMSWWSKWGWQSLCRSWADHGRGRGMISVLQCVTVHGEIRGSGDGPSSKSQPGMSAKHHRARMQWSLKYPGRLQMTLCPAQE